MVVLLGLTPDESLNVWSYLLQPSSSDSKDDINIYFVAELKEFLKAHIENCPNCQEYCRFIEESDDDVFDEMCDEMDEDSDPTPSDGFGTCREKSQDLLLDAIFERKKETSFDEEIEAVRFISERYDEISRYLLVFVKHLIITKSTQ